MPRRKSEAFVRGSNISVIGHGDDAGDDLSDAEFKQLIRRYTLGIICKGANLSSIAFANNLYTLCYFTSYTSSGILPAKRLLLLYIDKYD